MLFRAEDVHSGYGEIKVLQGISVGIGQGEILGVNQSANAVSRILGPMAGVELYKVLSVPVLPYVFSVCLLVFVMLLTLKARKI